MTTLQSILELYDLYVNLEYETKQNLRPKKFILCINWVNNTEVEKCKVKSGSNLISSIYN